MLIDTHAHLDYTDYDPDRAEVIARATDAGVTEIISIGTRIDSSARAVELAENFPNIWATVGIHPCDVDLAPDDAVERLRALAQSRRVVALGEIGLDYHHLPENPADAATNKALQADLFRRQLDLTVELGLNAVIHQRDSWDDTLMLGSIYRTLADPKRFLPRYWQALQLPALMFKYRDRSVVT